MVNEINKEELNYIVSYNDALNKFTKIKKEAIEKLIELEETIIALFPGEIDSETFKRLANRIEDTIKKLEEA